ncbi:hypothetical protein GQ457_07G005420 [Hibiscus cannabinus]
MTRGNPSGPLLPMEPKIERFFKQRRRTQRDQNIMYALGHQGVDLVGDQDNHNAEANGNVGNGANTHRPRAIPDHLNHILDYLNHGIVAPEIQVAHFQLKPVMFNMLNSIGQFGGMPHGDARQHIRNFLEYNPPTMNTQLRNDIASFRQADDESIYECWNRYKSLLHKCSNHGFQDWTQVVMFYNGVNAPMRMMLDASANGTLLDKSLAEAFDSLYRIASNDYLFLSSRLGTGRKAPEVFELDAKDSVFAQISAITNMLKSLQRSNEVKDVKAASSACLLCLGNRHEHECPRNQESINYVGQVGRIASALQDRQQGRLPSDTEVTKAHNKEHCSALTLRSGTQINVQEKFGGKKEDDPDPITKKAEEELQEEALVEKVKCEGSTSEPAEVANKNATAKAIPTPTVEEVRPSPPFPQ